MVLENWVSFLSIAVTLTLIATLAGTVVLCSQYKSRGKATLPESEVSPAEAISIVEENPIRIATVSSAASAYDTIVLDIPPTISAAAMDFAHQEDVPPARRRLMFG